MNDAKSSEQALHVGSVSKPLRVRILVEDDVGPERLHWALRASFRALVTPRAWFKAQQRSA
jgi:hypothetical protein